MGITIHAAVNITTQASYVRIRQDFLPSQFPLTRPRSGRSALITPARQLDQIFLERPGLTSLAVSPTLIESYVSHHYKHSLLRSNMSYND